MSDYYFEKYPAHATSRSEEYVRPATLRERIVESVGLRFTEARLMVGEIVARLEIAFDNRPNAGAEDTADDEHYED